MGTWQPIVAGACGALGVLISIIDISDVNSSELGLTGIEASVGWGLWLTLAGSILLVVAVVLMRMRR
jgi:hypothetical protein